MPDILFKVNPDQPDIAALTAVQRRFSRVVIGSEIEKMNFVQSSAGQSTGFMSLSVPFIGGLTLEEFKWKALSDFYKARIADMVHKGLLLAISDGIRIPASGVTAGGSFESDWVLQETYINGGEGNNAVPTVDDEGIYILDSLGGDVSYRITLLSGTQYNWQLYEWDGATWSTVTGHSGSAVTATVVDGVYTPPSDATRLYLYVAVPASGGSLKLEIGKATSNYISTYDRSITSGAPDPLPTDDVGINVTGRDRLNVTVEFTTPGGTPSVDVTLWERTAGVWAKVRSGSFTSITSNWGDWFGIDRVYERMYVQLTNIDAGSTCAKTVKAIKLSD